ncbi:hypothetical protein PT2222_200130 [Paraburkholderia tropica]
MRLPATACDCLRLPAIARDRLSAERLDEFHLAARHELLDVHQDQHAAVHGAETREVLGRQRRAELRRGHDLVGLQREHVGHAVHHHAHHAMRDVQDDHDGLVVVLDTAQVKLDAHVHDRHDDAAQIDHALDEIGRVGDARDALVAADFLDLENVDAVLFRAQREDEELLTACVGLLRVAAVRASDCALCAAALDGLDFCHVSP